MPRPTPPWVGAAGAGVAIADGGGRAEGGTRVGAGGVGEDLGPVSAGRGAAAPRFRRSSARTSSAGTVKEIPWALGWTEQLMPINSPSRFKRAPPEFPRLIEASVWKRPWSVVPAGSAAVRPVAETMPTVT